MATTAQRIPALPQMGNDHRTQTAIDAASPASDLNIFRTMANHPSLLMKFLPLGGKLLAGGSLNGRVREIAILRTAYRAACEYELVKHRTIGAAEGMTAAEIVGIELESSHSDWSSMDLAVIAATDQLSATCSIDDSTWTELKQHFDDKQLIELIIVVGCYRMLAGFLNGVHVQLEDDVS